MADLMTCGEIIEPFIQQLDDPALPRVHIIGGNGSAALINERTMIDMVSGLVYAPASCDLPTRRKDGTLRDVDVLVLSTDVDQISSVEELCEQTVGDRLKKSIFGLKTTADLQAQQQSPVKSTAKVYVSDRYVELAEADGRLQVVEGYKALYPFKTPITSETLTTFMLSSPGRTPIPTSHPGATILNYLTRSISGERPKDADKVEQIAENILHRFPEVREWIYDGPGRPTLDLARVLHTLREPKRNPSTLQVGSYLQVVPYRLSDLLEHEGFMGTASEGLRARAILMVAHAKARLIHIGESQERMVTLWQKFVEDHIKDTVHNN